jgi:hypothetical protein
MEAGGRWHGSMAMRGGCGDEAMVHAFKRWVRLCCRSKPTGEQCLNNTRSREAHVAADGAP